MYILVSVLILIACVLLILVVLVQNSKGGGLASNFAGSNQIMGVRRTADFLEKATWTLAIVLLVLSMVSVFIIPPAQTGGTTDTELRDKINNAKQAPVQDYQAPPAQQGQPAQGQPAQTQPAQQAPAQPAAPAKK
jgi:preprotein translocase subunit SecG